MFRCQFVFSFFYSIRVVFYLHRHTSFFRWICIQFVDWREQCSICLIAFVRTFSVTRHRCVTQLSHKLVTLQSFSVPLWNSLPFACVCSACACVCYVRCVTKMHIHIHIQAHINIPMTIYQCQPLTIPLLLHCNRINFPRWKLRRRIT